MNKSPINLLITGATSDIGRSIIATFNKETGTKTTCLARNRDKLEELKKKYKLTYHVIDLNKPGYISKKLINLPNQRIDVLINCAGAWHNKNKPYYGLSFEEIPTTELFEVLNVNLISAMLITQYALKSMKRQGYGSIVNIIGTFSGQGKNWVHYFTAKKALEQMTYGLAAELQDTDIRINAVSPRDTKTSSLKKYFPDNYVTAVNPSAVAKLVYDISTNKHLRGQYIEVR